MDLKHKRLTSLCQIGLVVPEEWKVIAFRFDILHSVENMPARSVQINDRSIPRDLLIKGRSFLIETLHDNTTGRVLVYYFDNYELRNRLIIRYTCKLKI